MEATTRTETQQPAGPGISIVRAQLGAGFYAYVNDGERHHFVGGPFPTAIEATMAAEGWEQLRALKLHAGTHPTLPQVGEQVEILEDSRWKREPIDHIDLLSGGFYVRASRGSQGWTGVFRSWSNEGRTWRRCLAALALLLVLGVGSVGCELEDTGSSSCAAPGPDAAEAPRGLVDAAPVGSDGGSDGETPGDSAGAETTQPMGADGGSDVGSGPRQCGVPITRQPCGDGSTASLCLWQPDEPGAPPLRVSGCYVGSEPCAQCCPGEVSGFCPGGAL